jgi:hypothetical protein
MSGGAASHHRWSIALERPLIAASLLDLLFCLS